MLGSPRSLAESFSSEDTARTIGGLRTYLQVHGNLPPRGFSILDLDWLQDEKVLQVARDMGKHFGDSYSFSDNESGNCARLRPEFNNADGVVFFVSFCCFIHGVLFVSLSFPFFSSLFLIVFLFSIYSPTEVCETAEKVSPLISLDSLCPEILAVIRDLIRTTTSNSTFQSVVAGNRCLLFDLFFPSLSSAPPLLTF